MTNVLAAQPLASRLEFVRERIAAACQRAGRGFDEVTLIAVSKTHPAEAVAEAVRAGIRDLGENRVQEGRNKATAVAGLLAGEGHPEPTWHHIGNLQTNKVKAALGTFAILHGIDSERLLRLIDSTTERPAHLMIEVNVPGEATKFGTSPEELPRLLAVAAELPNVRVEGLMTVAPLAGTADAARPVFRQLRQLGDTHHLKHLSMGMTNDFEVAIEEGATFVRVGRALFGERA